MKFTSRCLNCLRQVIKTHFIHNLKFNNILFLPFTASIEDLYCFNYQEAWSQHLGWDLFNIQREFQRQGVPNDEWALSYLNTNYEVSMRNHSTEN